MKKDMNSCTFISEMREALSAGDFSRLENNHAIVSFVKGDSIVKQGMFSTNVAFLCDGLVKIHIEGPYHEQIVRLVKAPSYLALPTTFGDKINQYSVTAVNKAEVCFIDINLFRELLKANTDFSSEIILELCKNELDAFRRCANRTQRQARGNIAGFLMELSEEIFNKEEFVIPISQSEIGNLVDTSRENVSRIFSEFAKDGIIEINGKKIKILNKKSLQFICSKG